jgi:glycosyltransferase involved in cell wall biosynthesis
VRLDDLKVVHVSPRVQAHGGIEALHAVHRTLPLAQSFVALFDRGPAARPDYQNLDFNWRTTLGQMRRAFGQAMQRHAGSVVIYHNGWGLPFLASQDAALRRIIYCHADPGYLAREIRASAGRVDGALGVTPALIPAWKTVRPALDEARQCILPLPVTPPAAVVRQSSPTGEIVLGYAGRIEREQKRLDRLPELLRALDATGLRYRFELLGDGSLRASLEKELAGRVRFHGWRQGADYWRVLAGWDATLFFSDYEGSPIAMLEAMALGVLPFFPRIGGTMGDVYVPQVDRRCHYPAGNMSALASDIQAVLGEPAATRQALRAKAQSLVANHSVARYGELLTAFVRDVKARPRISTENASARRRWSDVLPLGLVARVAPGLLLRS